MKVYRRFLFQLVHLCTYSAEKVAGAMKPGDHGSTFAGGPLVCHAALAVMDRVEADGFLENVSARGEQLRAGLRKALEVWNKDFFLFSIIFFISFFIFLKKYKKTKNPPLLTRPPAFLLEFKLETIELCEMYTRGRCKEREKRERQTREREKSGSERATYLEGNPHVKEVRGSGLLVGVQLDVPAGPLVGACRDAGLLVITAGAGDVLRLLPPLVVTAEEVDQAVAVIAKAVNEL